MTATPPPSLPQRIGRYRVVERIGKGAMGAVYSALDEQLGRRVAIKLMLTAFEEDPDLRERFYREARITGQLAHRNIVTVFDLGEESGRPFIVMELLDGLPLNEHLQTAASPTLDAKLELMLQTCDGLQNAHEAGVVHRDVKPSNLLVLRDGTLKVLDFGVARLAASNLTAAGMLLGTPEYMSPEQARGQKMDARADVFSAAGVFYFILTGRPPFGARDLRKVLHAIIHDDPPPLTDDEAPEALRQVLTRALAKAPEDRYQQCVDMRAEIEQVRRSIIATTFRVVQAARDRYQQILALIEERRALGRSLEIADIDTSCDDALAGIEARFPAFADAEAPIVPMDRAVANAALEALQGRYNAEQAALAALHERADEAARPPSGPRSRGSFWRGLLKARGN
ncbi:MAG TPA: serine/threonine-protein kinase [Vicinamibacterales bacterium]|nr:serine/threonine-protein kinase [Vicinamibacterales bacterium]